ncbi:MAG: hypothetical protein A2622_02760 [Bdellovibrionales bacterium RIFCSPHIGHO2_01_FULL_40_29]|nr:MAG: hypothetical protein A2622_02760 [Bdellovibrionales bacterium RIFCSPHIGHO2_01_FULL_40_29]OFZ33999.1 MAG: hypothetical protein A3D17_03180 [Bdellovibrionales bacterium RIFCSPHIGHO2_02_FULL_40_15]
MKFLIPAILFALISTTAMAQYNDGSGYRRRPQPPRYQDPYNPAPPRYGHGGGIRGPQYTTHWDDLGVNRLPKLVSEIQTIYVGGRLVNEILIRAIDNRVDVESVLAYLANGQVVQLYHITGSIKSGREIRGFVDSRYSLRIDRLEIRAMSSNLVGSRAQMQVALGLAD